MTDNGSPYRSHAARRKPAAELGLRHPRTQPYRPRTNGKAERFIQTLLREWAYARLFDTSAERTDSPRTLAQPLQLHPTTRRPQPQARSSAAR